MSMAADFGECERRRGRKLVGKPPTMDGFDGRLAVSVLEGQRTARTNSLNTRIMFPGPPPAAMLGSCASWRSSNCIHSLP